MAGNPGQQDTLNSKYGPYDPLDLEWTGPVDSGNEAPFTTSDIKDAGMNTDSRDGALRYGKCVEAPRIT